MNKDKLQQYLKSPYKDGMSFLENIVFPIFGEDDFVSGEDKEWLDEKPEYRTLAANTGIRSVKLVGTVYLDSLTLQIFDVAVADKVIMERNRVTIQKLVLQIMTHVSCAFMLFHYDNDVRWDWRFTFCYKGGRDSENTDSKRYTFLLGPKQSCHTARDHFWDLMEKHDKGEVVDFKDLETAFSVEALSDEFFEKYKHHYERFVSYITGKAYRKHGNKYVEEEVNTKNDKKLYAAFGNDDKRVRDYVKRLLGRILFLHFVQKKGWLGLPGDADWDSGKGDFEFMKRLYTEASPEQQEDFLDTVLEPLFTAIDTNRAADNCLYDTKVWGNLRVPYLNGGLFERDADDEIPSRFPKEYFADLLEFLSQYNFTVDENDPNDAQVGIDPEMLSRIFENLLEDNKDKGAFYTPKEVVRHMCRESLIAYLQTGYDDGHCKAIRKFVETHDASALELSQPSATTSFKEEIDRLLREVKVCDPAIGSGAFPMGMLKEIFLCRCELEEVTDNAEVKRQIIQNNIYGVDIEKGAVEIARLRFWLSLIVDEKSPETLPNLDFKIMQGNSLIESYGGVDLQDITNNGSHTGTFIFDDDNGMNRALVQEHIRRYFAINDHEERKLLREKIDQAVKNLIIANNPSLKDKVNDLDVQGNTSFFLWHTWFNDVFNRPNKQGFDIVIGNPPYVQLQNNGGALAKLYEAANYKTFARTGDIYCLFYERGWKLLQDDGFLCFITSNKWMRAGYGEKLRSFFAAYTNPIQLIDFAGVKVFESASVDTNILLFERGKNQKHTICAKATNNSVHNLSLFVRQQHSVNAFTDSNSWVILSPIEQSIKEKIEKVGTPLKDWNINIYRGVLTGCNEAFIISTDQRNEILANCHDNAERKRTEELIRPILRGRDIKRYGYNWAGLWLINTHNGIKGKLPRININEYPSVKAHLNMYWNKISKRTDKGDTPYNLRNCAYIEDFDKPKIIYPETTQGAYFAFDDTGIMIDKTCFMLISNKAKYLQRILSSKLYEVAYKKIFSSIELGEHGYQYNKHAFVKLPIPKTKALDIDELMDKNIYDFFKLSKEEVAYIEDQTL